MAWRKHALKWAGWSSLAFVVLLLCLIGGALFWLAATYSRYHPLSLDPYLPRIEDFFAKRGVQIRFGHLEAFYDESPILRAGDIRILAATGDEPAVVVESLAVKFANRRLFTFNFSPKVIEASNVTLRLVRNDRSVMVAGMNVVDTEVNNPKTDNADAFGGVIEWLNTLYGNPELGRLKNIKIDKLNLFLRDEVQGAEWILENGRMLFTRYPDDGERASVTANIRRLYGNKESNPAISNVVMPVLVTFDHRARSATATLSARFDQTDTNMIADYLPPRLKDMLKAQGSVEFGTDVLSGNRFGQPWMTLRLNDAAMHFPEGYSKPLEFPKLMVTASYQPSPVDVLSVKEVVATGKRGNIWVAHGSVASLTTDPLIDVWVKSKEGDVQGIFDFFPDQAHGFDKALRWLRPNITNANYIGLSGHYRGKPSAFPDCEERCGLFDISASVPFGTVRYLPELTPAVGTSITFAWRGTEMFITAPKATIGEQNAENVSVNITKMFSPAPSHVLVSGTLSGGLRELVGELRKLDDTEMVPTDADGRYSGSLFVDVPMIRGKETEFSDTKILVDSHIANLRLAGVKELAGQSLRASDARVRMFADKSLRVETEGDLGGNRLKLVWQRSIDPHAPGPLTLNIEGNLSGDWLKARMGNPDGFDLAGNFYVAANVVEDVSGEQRFGLKAIADKGKIGIAKLNWVKPVGEKLLIESQGTFAPGGRLKLNRLDMNGDAVRVQGVLDWNPLKPDDTLAKFSVFKIGKTDAAIDYEKRQARISGKSLDISKMKLFEGEIGKKDESIENAVLDLDISNLFTEKGKLEQVKGQFAAIDGRWDVKNLTAVADGGAGLNIRSTTMSKQEGRRKLSFSIDNLGSALTSLGIYERLNGGKLTGDIVYDSPRVGGGVLKIEDFSLGNPPVLMQILSLVSLEQLVAGTDSTLFKQATLPIRLDGDQVYLDNASLEGSSMSIRLNGNYDRASEEMNFDGKLAPGIPLNRLIAKIPLLGTILTGSQEGLVVVDFKLKGPSSDPQVNVRPLSVVTPGLVKDLWRGLTSDSKKSIPAPKVIDGSKK